MRPETPKLLEDIRDACAFIMEAARGVSLDQYRQNRLVRQAVERNFEIIGEALTRLARCDAEAAGRIRQYPQIIAFRNILVHGYDVIDPEIVWDIIEHEVPALREQVERLQQEMPPPAG